VADAPHRIKVRVLVVLYANVDVARSLKKRFLEDRAEVEEPRTAPAKSRRG
jgi:hypothetical protein